jgi:hypothetical protein
VDSVEMLVPHLNATLALDWSFPHLLDELTAAGSVGFEETHAQETYLARHDAPTHGDDRERSARFLDALSLARTLAQSEESLTFERLSEVQERLLGCPAAFREGDAFSHGGARRYLFVPELEEMFARKVRADAEDDCHPIAKAVRLYLDMAFFHPFIDGNARAARLTLEFTLRRAHLPTPPLMPLVLLPKTPGDVACYERCVRIVAGGIISAWREEGT